MAISVCLLTLISFVALEHENPFSSTVEKYLVEGKLEKGKTVLEAAIAKDKNNHQLKFELGVLRFVQSVEKLGQEIYEVAPRRDWPMNEIPFFRLPVPKNPNPKAVEYSDLRKIIQRFVDDLSDVDKILSEVSDDNVKISLPIMDIKMDLDRNGTATQEERLEPILNMYLGNRGRGSEEDDPRIVFDRADVAWLRGYCCLLRSLGETSLAYDQELLWNTVGHRLFTRGIVADEFLREENARVQENQFMNVNVIADLIAGIHNCRFEIKEPKRLIQAHKYLLEMIGHSRQMWEFAQAETDNNLEWIPSPSQDNPYARARVTEEMLDSWDEFLHELELLLNGEKLIPFWRGTNPKRGVNLKKMFYKPANLDIVLCIQGTGMKPYLEIGDCTSEQTWREFQRVFRGNFFGFAIWFN